MVTGYAGLQYQEVYLNCLFYMLFLQIFDCKCSLACFKPVDIFVKFVHILTIISDVEVQNFGTN